MPSEPRSARFGRLRPRLPLLLLALSFSACAASSDNSAASSPMEILHLASPAAAFEPLKLELTPIGPPAGPAPAAAPAAVPPPSGFTHLHGGLDAASRGVAAVASGAKWKQAWSARLQAEFDTFGLLAAGDRILVLGRVHELVSAEGKSLYSGLTGPALPGLYPAENAWLTIDSHGVLQRRRLADGGIEFAVPAFGGDDYKYSFIGLQDGAYLIAGSERQLDPHGQHRPSASQVQRLEVKPPFEVDPSDRMLLDAKGGEALRFPALYLLPVARGGKIVFATNNLLLNSDFGLSGTKAFGGEFAPLAASLDEAGGIHLLIKSSRGLRYWKLSAQGARQVEVVLPVALPERIVPPILGYDGRVYLRLVDRILVVEPDGSQRASIKLNHSFAAAVAQPDGTLLVADGAKVWHFNRELRASEVLELASDAARTPPVAISPNRIYVASDSTLYCFERVNP